MCARCAPQDPRTAARDDFLRDLLAESGYPGQAQLPEQPAKKVPFGFNPRAFVEQLEVAA